jgi:arabinose-5-phosphate isomerase
VIVDEDKKILGIFTDGDLRRHLQGGQSILNLPIEKVMTKGPIVMRESDLATKAVNLLKKKKVDEIPVVDDQMRPVGMVDVQDLVSAGII